MLKGLVWISTQEFGVLIYILVSLSGALQAGAVSRESSHSVISGLCPAGSQHLDKSKTSRETRSDSSSGLPCPHPSVNQGSLWGRTRDICILESATDCHQIQEKILFKFGQVIKKCSDFYLIDLHAPVYKEIPDMGLHTVYYCLHNCHFQTNSTQTSWG